VKGVVDWLSPKKTRPVERKVSGKENQLSRRDERFSLSDDDDADTSVESTSTLVASTPKKDKVALEPKSGVELLLQFCSTEKEVGFKEYIGELLATAEVQKLGEASYSEVFTLKQSDGTTTVLKIVPFSELNREKDTSTTNLDDILQEIRISRAMTSIDGFANFKGYTSSATNISAVVAKGSYPPQLLAAWDSYSADSKSENDRPSKFSDTQKFCIIHLSHHGQDLETYDISTWSEAAHIFWSVIRTLSLGEKACEFEHRDLHWGNILIDKSEDDEVLERLLDNLNLEDGGAELLDGGWGGVKVTLIDYTLSRARVDDIIGHVAHYGFEDESLFEGKSMPLHN
jgi:serine/threonine-protein kinase haspin